MKKYIRSAIKKTGVSILIAAIVAGILPGIPGENRSVQATAKDAYYASWSELGTTYNHTITGNYKVTSNTVINAGSGCPGIIISGTVNLYIKSGCTLTVNGANGSGTTRGCAGIRLVSGNVLRVYGGGTLRATGGSAASGEQGGMNAANAYIYNQDGNDPAGSGSGGAGGSGGGGAGAGIGGNGGDGGSGGAGGSQVTVSNTGDGSNRNGSSGSTGSEGSRGESGAGTLYVFDTITLYATGGSAGYGGGSPGPNTSCSSCGGGSATNYCVDDAGSGWRYNYQNGGGGVGGGGGGGGAAANVGGGGSGGGGGGGAGSGGLAINGSNDHNYWSYPYGGGGGGGHGAYNGTTNAYVGHSSGGTYGDGHASGTGTGGSGAGGGVTYSGGSGGTVYVSPGASISALTAGSGSYAGASSSRYSMSTVTVQANKADHNGTLAKFATSNSTSITTYAYAGLSMSGIDDIPTLAGYTLQGFYSETSGGTKLMNADGTPTENAWLSGYTTVYAQWTANQYTLTVPTEGINALTVNDITAGTSQNWSSIATTATQTYTMTYDHQYKIEATPEKDAEGKAKTFIAWYATLASPATTLQSNNYNSTDNPYTFWCPVYATTLKGVALKGVWAEDEIKIQMADFKKAIVYKTATVTTKLDDKINDMGNVTLVSAADSSKKYAMSGKGGVYTYTVAQDTNTTPQTYKIYVNGVDTGKTTNFGSDSTLEINYYTATVTLKMDGTASDMGTVMLEPVNSDTAESITLNYDKDTCTYSYYAQKDETKDTSGKAVPVTYKVMLNGKACPGNTETAMLISFDKTCSVVFNYYSVQVTTNLDDARKYMGKITLKSGDTTAYTLTGNDGSYSVQTVTGESTLYDVYRNDQKTGQQVSFTDASKRTLTLDYYTVSYDGNANTDGTVPVSSILLKGSVFKLSSAGDLAKTNYSFGGWTLGTDTNTIYTVGQPIKVTGTMPYKAVWLGYAASEARWKGTKDTDWNYGTLADAIDTINLTTAGLDVQLLHSASMLDSASFTLDQNETFTVNAGATLTVPSGVQITNNGVVAVKSTATVSGSGAVIVNNGKIDGDKTDHETVDKTTGGTIAVSEIQNSNGNIQGGIIGSDAVHTTVSAGTVNGAVYLTDNSTFSGCSVDGGTYYEKKTVSSSVYTVTTDRAVVPGTQYYEYKDTYTEVADPKEEELGNYYIVYGDGYVQNSKLDAVADGVKYYTRSSGFTTVTPEDGADPSALGYYICTTTTDQAYEVTSDTAAIPGKTYYILDDGNYVICSNPDFANATVISVMGGTTISNAPTDDQLKYNLGGIVKYDKADNKLRLSCNTIFRAEVTLSGISVDTSDYKTTNLTAPVVTVNACDADDIVADGYASAYAYKIADKTGGTVRLKYTQSGTTYDSGDIVTDRKAVASGTKLTLSAKPAEGYEFAGWYSALTKDTDGNVTGGSGQAVSTEPECTISSFSTTTTYYALFRIIVYDVTVRADKGADLTATCGDETEAVSIPADTSHLFKVRYGYGITMSYSITDPDTYAFNGWFERNLTPGDDYNKEYPVQGISGNSIQTNVLTISKITANRIFIATTAIAGKVHYSLNGGTVTYDGTSHDSIDEDITAADVKSGYHTVTKYAPAKDGWEFLYWIAADGEKYKLDETGSMSKVPVKSQTEGITLTAVYGAASNTAFWTLDNNGTRAGGYTTLDAAVTATRSVNSPSYGCRTIQYDDSAFTGEKDRTVYGTLPDSYTFSTALTDLMLSVKEGYSLQIGTETGKGDIAENSNNNKDGSWHTGATLIGISLCSNGGKILIDGQRSTDDSPISLYPDNKLYFISDPNTMNYFNVTLLNSSGAVDTGSSWDGRVFVSADATDGDTGSTDAASDLNYNLMPGRVKITNYTDGRVYFETCDYVAADNSADTGYSLVAHKMSGAPAGMAVPFTDTTTDYTDVGFVTTYASLQDAITDVERYNSGADVTTDEKTGKSTVNGAADNVVYVTADSSEDIIIAGDNPGLSGADFVTAAADNSKNYNPYMTLIPAIYTVTGTYHTALSAERSDALSRTLSGSITVAAVSSAAHSYNMGSVWELQNLVITGTVSLQKSCSIYLTSAKIWGDSEKIILNPQDLTDGTLLVSCGGTGNQLSHFTLTDRLIAAGYVIYYDSDKDAIRLGDVSSVYAVDETLENKGDGTLHAAAKNFEYINEKDWTGADSDQWIAFTDTIAKDLVPGSYYVRIAATDTTTASTVRKGLEVGKGRKIKVLFRQAPTTADGADATVHEDTLLCVYDGSVTTPEISARTGYEADTWNYTDEKGEKMTCVPKTALKNIHADMTVTASYKPAQEKVTLPVSTELYTIKLSDGTKVTTDNREQTVTYGQSLSFSYTFNSSNGQGIVSYDAAFTVQRGSAQAEAVVLNADGSYVITGITADTQVELTGKARKAAPAVTTQAETSKGSADGKITAADDTMEYIEASSYSAENPDNGWSAVGSGITEISPLAAGTYYVRYKAADGTEASAYSVAIVGEGPEKTHILSLTVPTFEDATYGSQPDARHISISSIGTGDVSVVSVASGSDDFVISGSVTSIAALGCNTDITVQPKSGLGAGDHSTTITVTYYSDTAGTQKETVTGDITYKVSKADQAAPTGIAVQNETQDKTATEGNTDPAKDGSITGVPSGCEFKGEGGDWSDVSDNTISNLSAGTYYVRYKEDDNHNASDAVELIVGLDVTDVDPEDSTKKKTETQEIHQMSITGADMPDVIYGYSESPSSGLMFSNTGNQSENYSVSLTSGGDSFSLDGTTSGSMDTGNTGNCSIKLNTGLTVGTYSATAELSYHDGSTDSVTVEVRVVKASQSAPSGLTGSAGLKDGSGSITGFDSTKIYEYSADGGKTWTTLATGSDRLENLSDGTYEIRFPGDDNTDVSDPAVIAIKAPKVYLLNIPDIDLGTIAYTSGSYAMSVFTIASTGNMNADISSCTVVNPTMFTVSAGNKSIAAGVSDTGWKIGPATGLGASDTQYADTMTAVYNEDKTATANVKVKIIRATRTAPKNLKGIPESVLGANDGSIGGLTEGDSYEYSPDGSKWYTLTPGTKLAYGDYFVRYAQTDNYYASAASGVTVGEGKAVKYTLTLTAPSFASVTPGYAQPEEKAFTITSSGNSDATIQKLVLENNKVFTLSGPEVRTATVKAGTSDVTAAGALTAYTVRPMIGLGVGTYSAKAILYYNDGLTSETTVSFTVSSGQAPSGGEQSGKSDDGGNGDNGSNENDTEETTEPAPVIKKPVLQAPIQPELPVPQPVTGNESTGSKGKSEGKDISNLNTDATRNTGDGADQEESGNVPDAKDAEKIAQLGSLTVQAGGESSNAGDLYEEVKDTEIQPGSIMDKNGLSVADVVLALADEQTQEKLVAQAVDDGYVIVTVVNSQDKDAVTVSISDENSLMTAVLSAKDIVRVLAGSKCDIRLEITPLKDTDVSAESMKLVDKAISGTRKLGCYFDASLYKVFLGETPEQITELSDDIDVTMDIPKTLLGSHRTYQVILTHKKADGSLESQTFDDKDNVDNTFSFATSKLCTGAILYKDRSPLCIMNIILMIAIFIVTAYACLKRKKKYQLKIVIAVAALFYFLYAEHFHPEHIVVADMATVVLAILFLLELFGQYLFRRSKKQKSGNGSEEVK